MRSTSLRARAAPGMLILPVNQVCSELVLYAIVTSNSSFRRGISPLIVSSLLMGYEASVFAWSDMGFHFSEIGSLRPI